MKAEIIAVGTELLLGQIANTNAQFLSQELARIGIDVFYHTVVGDNAQRLLEVAEAAGQRSDLIIFTGGLGPTEDDLTKETVAQWLQLRLHEDEFSMRHIEQFFRQRGRVMTPNNRKQAMVLQGSHVFPNDVGLAPGMAVQRDNIRAVLLPGPPFELQPMVTRYVIPYLAGLMPQRMVVHSRVLRFFGIGESQLEAEIADLIRSQSNPTIAPLAKAWEVTLRLTAKAADVETAESLIHPLEEELKRRFWPYYYGTGETTLPAETVALLRSQQRRLFVAESCTGGQLSRAVTDIPGASSAFCGGITCYSAQSKSRLLGVPADLIERWGVVSEACAVALAENGRGLLDADFALSVTGVAGPEEQEGKPVGLVYIGLAERDRPTVVEEHRFSGIRSAIQRRSVNTALLMLFRRLRDGE